MQDHPCNRVPDHFVGGTPDAFIERPTVTDDTWTITPFARGTYTVDPNVNTLSSQGTNNYTFTLNGGSVPVQGSTIAYP